MLTVHTFLGSVAVRYIDFYGVLSFFGIRIDWLGSRAASVNARGHTLFVICPVISQSFTQELAVGVEISTCKDADKMLSKTLMSRGEKRQVGLCRISACAGTYHFVLSPEQQGKGPEIFTPFRASTAVIVLYRSV